MRSRPKRVSGRPCRMGTLLGGRRRAGLLALAPGCALTPSRPGAADLRRLIGPDGPHIASVLPEVREVFPTFRTSPTTTPIAPGSSCSTRSRGCCGAAAREGPIVLILDDLHAADEPSLLLLRFVSMDLAESGIVVLAIYREGRAGRQGPTDRPARRGRPRLGGGATRSAGAHRRGGGALHQVCRVRSAARGPGRGGPSRDRREPVVRRRDRPAARRGRTPRTGRPTHRTSPWASPKG